MADSIDIPITITPAPPIGKMKQIIVTNLTTNAVYTWSPSGWDSNGTPKGMEYDNFSVYINAKNDGLGGGSLFLALWNKETDYLFASRTATVPAGGTIDLQLSLLGPVTGSMILKATIGP